MFKRSLRKSNNINPIFFKKEEKKYIYIYTKSLKFIKYR